MPDYAPMKKLPLPPLPIKIPFDYADLLGCSVSQISHINSGRRQASIEQSRLLIEASLTDPRLEGLHYIDLHPEQPRDLIKRPLPKRLKKLQDKKKKRRKHGQ
jgi:hypothetical protein